MTAPFVDAAPLRGDRRRSRRESWRDGGSTVAAWDGTLLGWSLVSLAAAVLAIAAARSVLAEPAATVVAGFALAAGLIAPVVLALVRSRPEGLLRISPVDLLYAVVLGGGLRLAQGALSAASTGADAAFPSYSTFDGALPVGWWWSEGVVPVLVMPTVEEFFFRGVLLISVYAILRRPMGSRGAAVVAVISTSAAFVAMHMVSGPLLWPGAVSLGLVAVTCGLLVLLTGRIWGAVLTHVVYNGTWVALSLVGTFLT